MTEVFVEQPLASPGSANKGSLYTGIICDILQNVTKQCKISYCWPINRRRPSEDIIASKVSDFAVKEAI